MTAVEFHQQYPKIWEQIISISHKHSYEAFHDQDINGEYRKGWLRIREIACKDCRKMRRLLSE